jgi:hypothetical protein
MTSNTPPNGRQAATVDGAPPAGRKWRVVVVCCHLRPGRNKRSTTYVMQPLSGLHVASHIDQRNFDVELHHEDWHGPFDTGRASEYDLVFLSGLQPDFDRMRQLAYFFRRAGATVIAGGSVCTLFPEFATQFFDAVCVGSVDCVPQAISDFRTGSLKPIYRSTPGKIASYEIDYTIFARARINPVVHLIEASRGCSFRCSFCVIPAEHASHASVELAALARTIDNAIAVSPPASLRRWYPMVMFLDNNFSDNLPHMLQVCDLLRKHPKVRGWAALVTQNVLADRALVERLARSKCIALFVGLESLDKVMLRRFNKKQNLGKHQNILEDIAFAESLGIGIGYGYLFDPRFQTAAEMRRQVETIARAPSLPMPTYLSVVAPLAGTASFWEDLAANQLAPNLRFRDLDGETICYARLADQPEALVDFVEKIFRRPWTVVGRLPILLKTLRRLARSGTLNPIRWWVMAQADLHCFLWSKSTPVAQRTYLAGSEILDPQYAEYPADLSEEDRRHYFDPIALTDSDGQAAEWLKPYVPRRKRRSASTKAKPEAPLILEEASP